MLGRQAVPFKLLASKLQLVRRLPVFNRCAHGLKRPSRKIRLRSAGKSVLKTGRRYKAPTALPLLHTPDGEPCHDRPEFLKCLSDHFATAERATCQRFQRLHTCIEPAETLPHIQIAQVPTLEALARSVFAGLKLGNAPGVSGLPAKIFCPLPAAWALSRRQGASPGHA